MNGLRYQDAPWYTRLGRRIRYQPWSWFVFLKCLWYYWRHPEDAKEDDLSLREIWGITQGLWQVKANWMYDWEDLKQEWEAEGLLVPEEPHDI